MTLISSHFLCFMNTEKDIIKDVGLRNLWNNGQICLSRLFVYETTKNILK